MYKGNLPQGWELARIEDIAEIIMGQSPPSSSYNEEGNGLPFLQGKAEFGEIHPNIQKYTTQPLKIAEKGDILISVRAPVGDVNLAPYRVCIGRGLAAIRIVKGNNLFFFYWFKKIKPQIESLGKGSTFKAITKRELENLKVIFPPLEEQKAIAKILSTIDKAIQKVDEIIVKTERLKKGLMQRLLTKGVNLFAIEKEKILTAVEKAHKSEDHRFGREENLTHHLARYLQEQFPEYNVDVETEKSDRLRPDIIIHKRNNTNFNLFAFEVKKEENLTEIKQDIEKLEKLMLEEYRYCEAVFIGFNIANVERIFNLSDKVNFVLIDPKGKLHIKVRKREFKNTPIGKIPKEWEVVKLSDIAKLESGGTPSRQKPEYWENGTLPWVKSGELNDGVIYDTEEKITELGLKNSSAKIFPKGTLLIALYGATVGKTGLLEIDASTNQAVCAILPKSSDSLNSRFLQYCIIFLRKGLIVQSSGGAQPNIYLYVLKGFKIPLPPLPEQQKIAEILSIVDKKLELERKRKEKLEKIKKGMMNLLLTGKVRVRGI